LKEHISTFWVRKRAGESRIWMVLLLAVVLLLLGGCSSQQAEPPVLREPAGVRSDTVEAVRGAIYQIEQYDAWVKPGEQALYFETDGRVTAVYAWPGDYVQAGDVLAELDTSAMQETLQALEERLEYIRQDDAYAGALLELDIELLETELRQLQAQRASEVELALKQNEITQRRAELRQLRALREPEIKALQQKMDQLNAQLEQCVLRAPVSGRIVYSRELTQGCAAAAYQTMMCIAPEDEWIIEAKYIPESLLNTADYLYAQVGSSAFAVRSVPVDEEARLAAALSGGSLPTHFVPVEEQTVETGSYAAVYAVRNYTSDALLIPSGALLGEGDARYVYIQEEGERVRRAVEVGLLTDSTAQIVRGLEEGETVYVQE